MAAGAFMPGDFQYPLCHWRGYEKKYPDAFRWKTKGQSAGNRIRFGFYRGHRHHQILQPFGEKIPGTDQKLWGKLRKKSGLWKRRCQMVSLYWTGLWNRIHFDDFWCLLSLPKQGPPASGFNRTFAVCLWSLFAPEGFLCPGGPADGDEQLPEPDWRGIFRAGTGGQGKGNTSCPFQNPGGGVFPCYLCLWHQECVKGYFFYDSEKLHDCIGWRLRQRQIHHCQSAPQILGYQQRADFAPGQRH